MIGELYQPRRIDISLDEHQLAATVEATHDALIKRVRWTVTRESQAWNDLDFPTVKACVAQLAEAYTTFMFAARDVPDSFHSEFYNMFSVDSDMWNIINAITYGKGWENVPIHPHMPGHPSRPACSVCDSFELA